MRPHVMRSSLLTLSVVSHQQADLVEELLHDIAHLDIEGVEVVLTVNAPERLPFDSADFDFPLRVIENDRPKGFGANHNQAFRQCKSPYFCVLNPDLRLFEDPFPALIQECEKLGVGVVAPLIVNSAGEYEDSARRFPTVPSLARKWLHRSMQLDYGPVQETMSPDWVAGMFVLMHSSVYQAVGGFDERYFLYYEDVDLCRRIRKRGLDVRLVPSVKAIHQAQRRSHRSLKYMRWHAESMARFFLTRPDA